MGRHPKSPAATDDVQAALYRPLRLADGVHASALRTPGATALAAGDRSLTWAELGDRTRRVTAAAIHELGILPGDRVAILAPNCLEYPELACGLADAAAIVVTLNPRGNALESSAACDDCAARVLFVHESLVAVAPLGGSLERSIVTGPGYEAWLLKHRPLASDLLPPGGDEAPFTLVYSSGTTGAAKGILISHRSRVLTFHAMAMEYACFGPEDRFLAIAPMAHGAGFAFALAGLYFGSHVDIVRKFDAEQVLHRLCTEGFTGVFLVPTLFTAIFSLPESVLARYRGQSPQLRTIISNAAALPQAMKEQIVAYFGEGILHETYGSTEAGIVTNIRPKDLLRKPGSVGLPFAATEIRLLDENGEDVATGEVGELFSRSPYLFNGYWNQPDATRNCMHAGGWISAGDLARRDVEGFLYIVDRKKDMVISGGVNIYPREIEDVLQQHVGVREASVVGVPDPYWGESLLAYVVVDPLRPPTAEALIEHCRAQLSGYKVPRAIRFVDLVPRNAGGKVLKRELRERA